jgi:hypothetical protein
MYDQLTPLCGNFVLGVIEQSIDDRKAECLIKSDFTVDHVLSQDWIDNLDRYPEPLNISGVTRRCLFAASARPTIGDAARSARRVSLPRPPGAESRVLASRGGEASMKKVYGVLQGCTGQGHKALPEIQAESAQRFNSPANGTQ